MRSSRLLTTRARRVAVVCAALGALTLGADACTPKKTDAPEASENDAAVVSTGAALTKDAGVASAADAGRGNVITVGAASFAVSVIDRPAWPESGTGSKRLGYLRHGATTQVYDKPVVNDDCKDGWLAVVTGGWVCGKLVTQDLSSPRVRLAPKQADRDAGMPYRYGVNLGDGTPLYRRVLGEDDRKKYEGGGGKSKSEKGEKERDRDEANAGREGATSEGTQLVASPAPTPVESEGEHELRAAGAEEEKPAAARETRETKDAGPPSKPRLKDLRGRGVLVRKMARGFYLALDRDFKAAGTRWWRTTYGFATPFDKIMLHTSVTKHRGSWFADTPLAEAVEGEADGGANELIGAVGFVNNGASHQLLPNEEKTKIGWGPELPKRSSVLLTGRTYKVDGMIFHEAAGGFWVRLSDLKLAKPAPPSDLAPDEKWIDVDLTRQALVAFQGKRPVFATLISSGRRNTVDKEKDFPTPPGTYWIREKHVTTTMDGDVASDGPYSIEDVPWVMYFQGSYALHGAFWHDQFGNMRSHGCVNMSPEDARTLFGWSDPPLPEGWHGVFAKDEKAGTRVVIHEDPQPKRHRRAAPPPTE